MNKIKELQSKIYQIDSKIKPLESQRTKLYNQIKKIKENKSKDFIKILPEKIEDYSKEQLEWLLYHYHDELSIDYNTKNKIFTKLELFTCGINGLKKADEIRQYLFLANKHYLPNFLKVYKIFKPYLKQFKSIHDDELIVILQVHKSILDMGEYETGLEISLEKNKGRFVNVYNTHKKPTKWYKFGELVEIFNTVEHDY